ncbi:Gfo/Idh/MocA family protein [Photobacterium halotolerans]|uniref:Gfo/Idh/MocA family oxidoreductase n=1 Tax=Photobacterium halotolerans TaxID=265726 RepID=A0A7X4WHB2_9GAMM|nr:Gfo/Idh/MocA family oxidoreductase [Photobacterium halotolerans]NAW67450.1 Gfo/Idh/MocA family oxidoreductase [Photobacterium halotolerans]
MLRVATIGTNWITDSFIEAAQQTGKINPVAVYSRTMESAEHFARKHQIKHCFDDLEAMANSDDIDAVYIASPNAFHASQAEIFIRAGKHVMVEKPMASNIQEVEALIELAQAKNVVLFEALKTTYNPNFAVVRNSLSKIGRLRKAHFNFCQYSSRYDKYLNGENPNTFNPEFANGSLMDIGIYPLSVAIALFGEPKSFTAQGALLDSGVDGHGTLVLHYGDFDAVITHSKVSDSKIPCELQGEQGTLVIDTIAECRNIVIHRREEPDVTLSRFQAKNTMQYEAAEFARLIEGKDYYHSGLERSRIVHTIITVAREIIGIRYPADS